MRPRLPSADKLQPYLQAIDSSRIYSNFGPLARLLEDRLAQHFGLGGGTITTVANATLGLALSLAAQGAKPGTLCVMPAWTFVASPQAATMAGLIPYFVDVDEETSAIDPEIAAAAIARAPGTVGAIMPVAPFGRPIDVVAWDEFRARTGVPVVIDAAAGFDAIRPSAVPAVVSLHATKVLGVGEGGFIMSTDRSLIGEARARSNFGFAGTREAVVPAMNAKLSEYHAAVGLAGLDEWTNTREEWMAVAQAYRKAMPDSNRAQYQRGFGQTWIASTCVMRIAGATRVEQILAQAEIETRRWWGDGAHTHRATKDFPHASLATTEVLSESTIALPFFRDLAAGDIHRVAESLRVVAEQIEPR